MSDYPSQVRAARQVEYDFGFSIGQVKIFAYFYHYIYYYSVITDCGALNCTLIVEVHFLKFYPPACCPPALVCSALVYYIYCEKEFRVLCVCSFAHTHSPKP